MCVRERETHTLIIMTLNTTVHLEYLPLKHTRIHTHTHTHTHCYLNSHAYVLLHAPAHPSSIRTRFREHRSGNAYWLLFKSNILYAEQKTNKKQLYTHSCIHVKFDAAEPTLGVLCPLPLPRCNHLIIFLLIICTQKYERRC